MTPEEISTYDRELATSRGGVPLLNLVVRKNDPNKALLQDVGLSICAVNHPSDSDIFPPPDYQGTVSLRCCLVNLATGPGIKVTVRINRGGAESIAQSHYASVTFYCGELFNPERPGGNKNYHGILPDTLEIEQNDNGSEPQTIISFESEGAVAANVNPPTAIFGSLLDLAEDEKCGIAWLTGHAQRTTRARVKIFCTRLNYKLDKFASVSSDPLSDFINSLAGNAPEGIPELRSAREKHFYPYKRSGITRIMIERSSALLRTVIVNKKPEFPFIAMPRYVRCPDSDAAQVIFAYGLINELEEVKFAFESISHDEHIETGGDASAVEVHGAIVKNELGIINTDLMVLVTGSNASSLFRSADHHNAKVSQYCCHISPQVKETALITQIDAARAQIVLGPSGSGKTTMQVKKGLILTRLPHYKVVSLSESNAVADDTLDQILEADHDSDARARNGIFGMFLSNYWSDSKIALARYANDSIRAAVLQDARILITTNQNCADRDIRKYFASSAGDKVFIESDECFAATEHCSLIPIATTAFARNIVSIVYYGNETQMGPIPLRTTRLLGKDEKRSNEFHAQLQCSLVERMIKSGFPVHRIDYQGRCHPILFEPVSSYYFQGKIDSPDPKDQRFALSAEYHKQLRAVLKLPIDKKLSDEQERMVHVKVRGKQPCQKVAGGSRGNYSSFHYIVTTMLPAFDKILGDDMHDMLLVVTPYARQADMWTEWCSQQIRAKLRTRKQLPRITTVDSSETAEHVIVDLVIDGEHRKQLGHLKDNRQFHNLATRAKSTMWQIMSDDTGEERYLPSVRSKPAPTFVDDNGNFDKSKKAFWFFINWYTRHKCIWHLDNNESFDFFNAPRDLMLSVERDALDRFQAVKEQVPTAVSELVPGDLTAAQTKQLRGIAIEIADEQWQAEHLGEKSAYELWKATVIRPLSQAAL
ncbi:uncharacterized protein MYCGRDRAFT_92436 [Zymoseptoria tritici IPO323]|uniref:DNA2/NAM7 helicase-like C-terminal domain-containing protein n=1 Tax=Zymoseptoria tritici (strain CBS 115943 / IPO323) TaxID=336722 RepID=F9X8D4_ZYMTI|nr:uncharacterized protein MYCGRDRAFT_92436 [Zymoseptoria tritici IPO323]EGP87898.1 hypothetical protein MYCGRDRAFT_92436 [Zymoseptoria tritici IPO323]